MNRPTPIEKVALGIAEPHLYVARWYVRVNKGGKKRIRKYLRGFARLSWTSDPTKAWRWSLRDAAKAYEYAEHFKCDVVKMTETM